ncbi:MAG: hypothetical protein ABSF49_14225 [Roseiarcus sp.]|jgi:hypothetical protein|uniref:hypothetical protein n=1 Tax=Roseiarcus sp. TaxID=1969460 RepID=UPI003C2440E6
MSFEFPKNLKPIVDFAIHVCVGSIGFLIVFGAAVIISVIVKACDGIVPGWVETTGEYAEMALFGIDLICFGLFILSEAIRLVRGLWSE